MNVNWKLRLMNKTTLIALITAIVTCVYGVCAALGVVPSVTQEQVMDLVLAAVSVLMALGIVVDPTTAGISDSSQAMTYPEPKEG